MVEAVFAAKRAMRLLIRKRLLGMTSAARKAEEASIITQVLIGPCKWYIAVLSFGYMQ